MMSAAVPLTPMGSLRYDLVERLLDDLAPATVLEFGCGQGAVGARLAARAAYLGVEPDAQSCAVARQRLAGSSGQVLQGDHTNLPPHSRYDLVCAFEVLEHIEYDEKILAEWIEFIRPGGHILLSVPAWQSRFGPMDTAVGHFRRYSPDDMAGILRRAGLLDIQIRLYGWPMGYALEFVREKVAKNRRGDAEDLTVAERTAGSGRLFQPSAALGRIVRAGTVPFCYLQRLAPGHGTGIVAVARRAD